MRPPPIILLSLSFQLASHLPLYFIIHRELPKFLFRSRANFPSQNWQHSPAATVQLCRPLLLLPGQRFEREPAAAAAKNLLEQVELPAARLPI